MYLKHLSHIAICTDFFTFFLKSWHILKYDMFGVYLSHRERFGRSLHFSTFRGGRCTARTGFPAATEVMFPEPGKNPKANLLIYVARVLLLFLVLYIYTYYIINIII